MAALVGQIYRHAGFYVDLQTGALKAKYFLVLAAPPGCDVVVRLLTSRYPGYRSELPPCCHDDPYPGFYLGIPGYELSKKTWLDLRGADDLDPWDFDRDRSEGHIRAVQTLPVELFKAALACAANADDTTKHQERLIRDTLAGLD